MTRRRLHLFVLAAFAVAQPLFDVLGRSPEFFLVRDAPYGDVLGTVVLVSLGTPLVLLALEEIVGLFGDAPRRGAHLVIVAALCAAVCLPGLGRLAPSAGAAVLATAGVLGGAAAFLYAWFAAVRTFVTVLAPAIALFPGLFLLHPSTMALRRPALAAGIAGGARAGGVPVVVVVFDEFSSAALMNDAREIDPVWFPNFFALARDATWYRNATSVAGETEQAVAGILTGRYPERYPARDPANRARNLFTLLGGAYELHVTESYVPYCPPEVCASNADERRLVGGFASLPRDLATLYLHIVVPAPMRAGLGDLTHPLLLVRHDSERVQRIAGFLRRERVRKAHWLESPMERAQRFARYLDSIDGPPRSVLYYLHVMLPHGPAVHMPSGRLWTVKGFAEVRREGERTSLVAEYQRYLLQVGYVDTLVGRLVARLETTGLYDAALVILVADHGVSHRPDAPRRVATRRNYCDIMAVPLFVKLPGQRVGNVSDRNAELVDILPTIGRALGMEIPWATDGQALGDVALAERPRKVFVAGPHWELEAGLYDDARRLIAAPRLDASCLDLVEKRRWVGSGATQAVPVAVGPEPSLIGRRVDDIGVGGDTPMTVALALPVRGDASATDATVAPTLVAGSIAGPDVGAADLQLAIAINGVVRAVPGTLAHGGGRDFLTIVPETAFTAGDNVVEIFLVTTGANGTSRLLRPQGAWRDGVRYAPVGTPAPPQRGMPK
jgi:hypothetical protein